MKRLFFIIPVILFIVLAGFFIHRLTQMGQGKTPDLLPSVMIGKPVPDFDLPSLFDGKANIKSADLKGQVTLIGFFASWCIPCRAEHPLLQQIADSGVTLIGINYENDPAEARDWLAKLGNPYKEIAADRQGQTAIDFGLYGIPESYLIDKDGIIRFKQTGILTQEIIDTKLLPLARELQK